MPLHTESILNALTTTPLIITNDQGTVVFFNKGAENQLGYMAEEVMQVCNLTHFLLEVELQTIALETDFEGTPSFEVLKRQVSFQHPFVKQITFVAKNNDLWNCQMTLSLDEQNHYVVILQEMQKVAFKKNDFIASHQFLEGILKTTPDILYVYDIQQEQLIYSNRTYDRFDHEQAPFLRLAELNDLIHPDDFSRLESYREELKHLRKGQIDFIEYRVKNIQGGYSWLFTKDVVFSHNASGEVELVLGLARDVTEIKDANHKLEQSEALYRALIHAQQEIICRFLPDTTLTFVNEAYCTFFGKTKEELLGTQFWDIVEPEARPEIMHHLQKMVIEKKPITQEYKVLRGNRVEDTWIRWTDYPIFDEAGYLVEYQSVGLEITERKQIEIELQEQKQMLEKILNTLPIHVFIKDDDGRLLFVNQALLDFLQGSFEDFVGKRDQDVFSEALAEKFRIEDELLRKGELPDNWEEKIEMEGQDRRFFRTGKRLIPLQNLSYLLGYSFDITPLKEAQIKLKESEAKFRLIANNTKDLICLHAYNADFIYISPAIEGLTGYVVSELLHKNVTHWIHEEDREFAIGLWREMLKTKSLKVVEYRFKHKGGHWVWIESHLFPVYTEDGKLQHVQVNTRDITERKVGEYVLKQSRDYLIKVLEHIPDPIFVKNEKYQFISVNDAFCGLVGKTREQVLQRTDFDIYDDKDAQVFREKEQKALQTGELEELEWVINNAKNEQRHILAKIDVFRDDKNQKVLVGVIRDITLQKIAEQQLAHNERSMKAILTSFNDVVFEINQNLIFTNFWGDRDKLFFSEQEFLGKKVTRILEDPMRSYFTSSIRYVLDNKAPKTIEYPAIQKGEKKWYSCTINYLPETPDKEAGVSVLVTDVTPYKKAQQRLSESEEQLQDFLDNASLLIQSVDFDGNIQYVNRYWCKKLGYSKAEALRTNIMDIIAPEEREGYLQFLQKLKQEGGAHQFNVRFIDREGNTLMLEGSINIRTGSKPLLTRSFLHDVTERNKAEKAILEQNRLFEAFLENSPIGIQIFDKNGNSLQLNDAQRNVLGVNKPDFDEINFNILTDKRAQDAGLDFFYKSAFGGESIFLPRLETEFNIYDKDGRAIKKEVCLNLIIFPIKNDRDEVEGVVTFTQDVSEQFSIEQELNESRYFIKSIADAIPNDVYVYDLEKEKYVYTNTQYFKYSGVTVKEIDRGGLNKVWALIHPDDLADVKGVYEEVYKGGEDMYEMVYRLACKPLGGRERQSVNDEYLSQDLHDDRQRYVWVYDRIVPFKINVEGRVTQILGVVQNITDNKNFEEQLIQAKQDAEEALKAKEVFLSTMSHEIRTPMNAVIGITHLLLQENPKPEQLENLNTLKFSSENLLTLINDILDYNKIEAGRLSFEEIDFNLREFINNVKQAFLYQAEEKGIELEFYVDHSVPNILIGDPIRLNQILTNLLGNAIKFTEKGFVVVKVKLHKDQTSEEGSARNKKTISFSVKDTGIGIAPDKISKIFDRFTQADSDTTRRFGGTGLGLAITKYLVEHQGGEIGLNSEVNKGSEFYFHLDFEVSKLKKLNGLVADNEGDTPSNLINVDLLLVEDRKINRMVASRFLKKWGITVDFAFNGLDAVEKVKLKKYDIILMDLLMPKMDGFEATRNIRKMESYQNTPIIALSASTLNEEREKARKVKMNDFVAKPFNPNELYHKIMKYTKQSVEAKVGEQAEISVIDLIENEYFNLSMVDDICAGDQEMRQELIQIFAGELLPAIENFKAAALSHEPEAMRIVVHNLKSSTELFGVKKLLDALQEARELSLNQAEANTLQPLLKSIDQITNRIVSGLTQAIATP